jgi:hypothetical protein
MGDLLAHQYRPDESGTSYMERKGWERSMEHTRGRDKRKRRVFFPLFKRWDTLKSDPN